MKKYELNELRVKPEMDLRLVRKMRHGVLASNQITQNIKNIIKKV